MGGGQSVASNGGEVREILNKMESERVGNISQFFSSVLQIIKNNRNFIGYFQLAKNREMFRWISSGGFVTILTALYSAHYHKNVLHILPVYPIFFYIAYEAHLCYGNKLEIIRSSFECQGLESDESSVTMRQCYR
ncbi:unnamed protein product [Dracunculus medinensis]|uniref:Transmembrane protein n=1 Tax=Dracunculus medinensis TaxID=318479 RepID=A0A0N4UFQ6_DRAME|nr:unnamed protein product [Dracunculus medinensis]